MKKKMFKGIAGFFLEFIFSLFFLWDIMLDLLSLLGFSMPYCLMVKMMNSMFEIMKNSNIFVVKDNCWLLSFMKNVLSLVPDIFQSDYCSSFFFTNNYFNRFIIYKILFVYMVMGPFLIMMLFFFIYINKSYGFFIWFFLLLIMFSFLLVFVNLELWFKLFFINIMSLGFILYMFFLSEILIFDFSFEKLFMDSTSGLFELSFLGLGVKVIMYHMIFMGILFYFYFYLNISFVIFYNLKLYMLNLSDKIVNFFSNFMIMIFMFLLIFLLVYNFLCYIEGNFGISLIYLLIYFSITIVFFSFSVLSIFFYYNVVCRNMNFNMKYSNLFKFYGDYLEKKHGFFNTSFLFTIIWIFYFMILSNFFSVEFICNSFFSKSSIIVKFFNYCKGVSVECKYDFPFCSSSLKCFIFSFNILFILFIFMSILFFMLIYNIIWLVCFFNNTTISIFLSKYFYHVFLYICTFVFIIWFMVLKCFIFYLLNTFVEFEKEINVKKMSGEMVSNIDSMTLMNNFFFNYSFCLSFNYLWNSSNFNCVWIIIFYFFMGVYSFLFSGSFIYFYFFMEINELDCFYNIFLLTYTFMLFFFFLGVLFLSFLSFITISLFKDSWEAFNYKIPVMAQTSDLNKVEKVLKRMHTFFSLYYFSFISFYTMLIVLVCFPFQYIGKGLMVFFIIIIMYSSEILIKSFCNIFVKSGEKDVKHLFSIYGEMYYWHSKKWTKYFYDSLGECESSPSHYFSFLYHKIFTFLIISFVFYLYVSISFLWVLIISWFYFLYYFLEFYISFLRFSALSYDDKGFGPLLYYVFFNFFKFLKDNYLLLTKEVYLFKMILMEDFLMSSSNLMKTKKIKHMKIKDVEGNFRYIKKSNITCCFILNKSLLDQNNSILKE